MALRVAERYLLMATIATGSSIRVGLAAVCDPPSLLPTGTIRLYPRLRCGAKGEARIIAHYEKCACLATFPIASVVLRFKHFDLRDPATLRIN